MRLWLSDLGLRRLLQQRNIAMNNSKPPTSPTVKPTIKPMLGPDGGISGVDVVGRSSAALLTHWEGGHTPQFCIVASEHISSLEQAGVHLAEHPVGRQLFGAIELLTTVEVVVAVAELANCDEAFAACTFLESDTEASESQDNG